MIVFFDAVLRAMLLSELVVRRTGIDVERLFRMRLPEGQMLAALSANKESHEQRVPRFSGRMLSSPDLFLHNIEGAFFDKIGWMR